MSVYKRMNSYMTANAASVLVKDNSAGFEKVKNENYAFLAESTTIDYQVQRNCDLMQIGDILDSKGYGLASPKGNIVFVCVYITNPVHRPWKRRNVAFYSCILFRGLFGHLYMTALHMVKFIYDQ